MEVNNGNIINLTRNQCPYIEEIIVSHVWMES